MIRWPRNTRHALAALWLVAACHDHAEHHDGHEHADDHPDGHDHHAEGHGHAAPVVRITRWEGGFELFAEHGHAVAGEPLELLLHLTVLEDFSALTAAEVTLTLSGPAEVHARSQTPVRPGIYALQASAPEPGTYTGRVSVRGPGVTGEVAGWSLVVYPDRASVPADGHHDDDGLISFLKEQQWKVSFATAFVAQGSVVPSVKVPGTVDAPPGGMAEVNAPIAGRLVAPPGGLPRPGQAVKAGQLLAMLAPAPSSPEGAARARLGVVEAEARLRAATTNLERARRLLADQAISQRELEDAQRELSLASQSVTAAKQVAALFEGARAGTGGGSWRLSAPIAGELVTADARLGATVSPDAVLFRIVDRRELWLKARVPEQDAARLQPDRGGSYRISGLSQWLPLRLGSDAANAELLAVSSVVDPGTRAVEVIYALKAPDARLRIDGLVTLELPVGEPWSGTVVPRSALIEEGGRALIYVQLDGEHFEERPVRVGVSAGDRVAILDGLELGERIVTEGANLLRLASRTSDQAPHGHIH